jgi:hypothetical protein
MRRNGYSPLLGLDERPLGPGDFFCGGVFFTAVCATVFSMDLQGAGSGVDHFGNVWPGGFSPVHFSDFKESLEEFSALPGGSQIGEFLRRRQDRLGMGLAVL